MYSIKSNESINWNAKGTERILQNVRNLLNTFRYEVAYDRVMGRDPCNIDKNINEVKDTIVAETYELIEEYEPRVKVQDVEVTNENGDMVIKVVVDV